MFKLIEQESKNVSSKTNNILESDLLKKLSSPNLENQQNYLLKGINRNMNDNTVKLTIIKNLAEQIGMDKNEKGQYVYKNYIMDEKQMINFMLKFHKEIIHQQIELNTK